MHVHPSSPNSSSPLTNSCGYSEENAAIKIQAGFRGYRVRKQNCSKNRKMSQNPNKSTSAGALKGNPSLDRTNTENNSIEDRCATKIQASVRGFLVRKKQKIASDAATKIQASFRGFKARKETQKMKQN